MTKLLNGLRAVLITVLELLPDSPFRGFIDNIAEIPYIGYLNYFVPVSDFLALLTVWGAAVGLFYVSSVILRFVKAID
jgi:hypothetical protein